MTSETQVKDLQTICAEAYQVIGVLASQLGCFGDPKVIKLMDNLSEQKLVHNDVLPFSLTVFSIPDGFKLMPIEMTDEIGEAIAHEANCCGGIALDIYDAALKAHK